MSNPGSDETCATRQGEAGECHDDGDEAARRAVLAQIGRFAYAAPALALLAQPKHAQAGYGGGAGGSGGGGSGGRGKGHLGQGSGHRGQGKGHGGG